VKIWIVGSGTLVPDTRHGAPAHWIEIPGASILLDCGGGTVRTLAGLGLNWAGVSHILLTHFHTDHVGGLAPLLFALKHGLPSKRDDPLTVLGPKGLKAHLLALATAHGSHVSDPGFPLLLHELTPGEPWQDPSGAFEVRTIGTRHTPESLGIRLEAGPDCLGYTGDTGPFSGLSSFFRACPLLIAECSHPDGWIGENHLTPSTLASLASEAGVGTLVPVHAYPTLDVETLPERLAEAGFTGRVLPGRDGLCLRLQENATEVLDSRTF